MMSQRRTLTQFLIEERRKHPQATGELNALVIDVSLVCKGIGHLLRRGVLSGATGYLDKRNDVGEPRHALDLRTHEIFVTVNEWAGRLAGMVSEELEGVFQIPARHPKGKYLLLFDSLDGTTISDLNASVGSIFSILRAPHPGSDATAADFLQPGTQQVCAGYALYGPSTMFVLTVGTGTHAFTLDPDVGEFMLTHPSLQIPASTSDFSINASHRRFWEPAVKMYVDECVAGSDGPRGRDFSMRWLGCLCAEAHRILMRGGVYLYPRDIRHPEQGGRMKLLYEVNPMAFLIEQAGGLATTGNRRPLELQPGELHQRVGFMFGARDEIERLTRYHKEHNLREYSSPLFGTRGLFHTPGRS